MRRYINCRYNNNNNNNNNNVLFWTTIGSNQGFQFVMVAWAYGGYPRSHFPPFWLQRQVLFPSRVSFYRMLLFSRILSSLHTYHVDQLCLEAHHPINPYQANSHFGTDQEIWPRKPWSNPTCQMNTRRPPFSQHQLLTVDIDFWHCLSLPVDFV